VCFPLSHFKEMKLLFDLSLLVKTRLLIFYFFFRTRPSNRRHQPFMLRMFWYDPIGSLCPDIAIVIHKLSADWGHRQNVNRNLFVFVFSNKQIFFPLRQI
jgi:hypothetical protein